MSVIGIMGESGSGKTTSMRNLDPKTTLYIDCDKKGLSWQGWKKQYNKANKNYMVTDDKDTILSVLHTWNDKHPEIKTIVIDTMNGVMVADEFKRRKEKTYDKWADLAWAVYEIIDYALTVRDDLNIILVFHSQTVRDELGYNWTCIKTSGQKLTKIGLETKLTTILYAKVEEGNYVFETQSNNSTAKSPMGLFDSLTIENDIAKVLEAINKYNG